MKLTESKLQDIIREEAKRLMLERKQEKIIQSVFDKLDATLGVQPRFNGENVIEAGEHQLRFIDESPIHLTVALSGVGIFREFQFDLTNNVNTPEAILDRVSPFIT
jgi:hypothetical protein